MKTINYLFSLLSLLLATTLLQAQPCETFTGATNTSPWLSSSAQVFLSSPGPSGNSNDQFISALDRSGVSYIYNNIDYAGDLITPYNGGTICWDINFVDDEGTGQGFSPKISLYSGSPGSPTREATFEANFQIFSSDGWVQVCAPIEVCTNNTMPSNLQGSWSMTTMSGLDECTDWTILLANVTGIKLDVEGILNDPNQIIGHDNICISAPSTIYGDCGNGINVNDFDNWIEENVTATLDVPGVDGPNDQYIRANDIGFGLSFIHNQVDFSGDYHTSLAGQEICWDYNLINYPNNSSQVAWTPQLLIYQGNPANPTVRARFTSSVTVAENDGWVRVCAPLFSCTEGLPSGPDGSWAMEIGGTGCDDWNTLLSNVTGLAIVTEVVSDSDQEIVGIDNVCLQPISAFGECEQPQGANSFENWETFNAFISVWDTAPNGPTGPGDSFLSTLDGFAQSYVYNEADFAGNWINDHLGEAFCFDFLSNNPSEVEFSFTIYQGNVLNPTRSATFTFNDEYDSFDGWNNFCAPIALCNNGQMPFNNIGSWNVDNGGSCQDWELLLSNVSGVRLNVETLSGNVSELFGFDNFCFGCDPDQYINVVGTPFGDRRYEFVTTGFISNNTPLTYTWDFGDGTPTVQTTDPDVEHQYQAEGTYIVCVTVEDAEGCSAGRCYQQEVICCDDIDATFTYTTVDGGRECYLQITSDTDGDWTLNGDPINPLPTIAVPDGVYQICRELEEETPAGLCRSLYCVVVKITDCEVEELSNNECPTPPPPCSPDCEASFTISNDGACLYEFTNTSSVPNGSQASYLWTFGDGSTSTMESPTHVYSSLTSYTVCLEISIPDGCLDEVCQQVSISELCDEDIFVAYTNCSSMQSDEACSFCFTAYGFTGTPGDQIAYYEWTYPGGTYIGQTLAFGGSGLVGDFDVCVTAVTNYGYQYSYCQTWNCHGVPAQSGNENTLRTNIPNTTATAEKGFEVFPNPATDYLTVTWDNELLAENSDLQIFNASGQIVKTFRVDHQDTEYRVNISDLSPGLYMLSMTQKDGSIVTKRLIFE